MVDAYTQIIVEEFRKHKDFLEEAQKWLAGSDAKRRSESERERYLAKILETSCLLSLARVRAPGFAHELLIRALDGVDWKAAARVLFLVNAELN